MLEQHPVPQNVTTFQFRLIGDMTLKQFGYLAGGAILAYISYNLPLPFFFRYPLTGIFALGGIGFAFIPIEERPMDVWFLSFIRSIYSPTQYLWQRETPQVVAQPTPQVTTTGSKKTTNPLASLFDFSFLTKPNAAPKKAVEPQPVAAPRYASVLASAPLPSIAKTPEKTPAQPPVVAPPAPPAPSAPGGPADPKYSAMEQKLKEMEEMVKQHQSSKEQLQKQLDEMQQKMSQQQMPPSAPAEPPPSASGGPDAPKTTGIPNMTTFTNVITGIVRERTGNLLVGILVTVKDKDDIPVRALKTNKMGQFAASTQLANGTYNIEVEDPKSQFLFEPVQVQLNGSILPSIEIIAKTKQELERQKLEQAVFGKI